MPQTKTRWYSVATTLLLVVALLSAPAPAFAKTEIQFWHAMTGQLNEAVNALVKQFNESQTEYEVKPLQKGNYTETLTAAIAAYRQRQAPHIVQVFEVGTQTMLLSGAVLPVYQLMKEQEIAVDWKDFIAPVVGYYSKDGNLYSMPFNSSTPILYYNKDAFAKAGLDPSKPPQTWKQVEEYSKRLISSGATKCGFSTGWPSWVQVENLLALHDQPFATKRNGFDGLDAQLVINHELGVKHMAQLAAWQKENVFSYGGRRGDADPKFLSGECGMYMQSSALIGGFTKGATFKWGTGQLPSYGAPYKRATSIIGGGHPVGHEGQAGGGEPRDRALPQVHLRHQPADVVARDHRLPRDLQQRGEEPGGGIPLQEEPGSIHRVRPAHQGHRDRQQPGDPAG
jgi:sn-glycerol 3-phosphate transport system substrate-binding protein